MDFRVVFWCYWWVFLVCFWGCSVLLCCCFGWLGIWWSFIWLFWCLVGLVILILEIWILDGCCCCWYLFFWILGMRFCSFFCRKCWFFWFYWVFGGWIGCRGNLVFLDFGWWSWCIVFVVFCIVGWSCICWWCLLLVEFCFCSWRGVFFCCWVCVFCSWKDLWIFFLLKGCIDGGWFCLLIWWCV